MLAKYLIYASFRTFDFVAQLVTNIILLRYAIINKCIGDVKAETA